MTTERSGGNEIYNRKTLGDFMNRLSANILILFSLFLLIPVLENYSTRTACAQSDILQGGPAMKLISTAFSQNQEIPLLYTCDGNDQSPPLSWSGIPDGCKSLALTVYDPDAPDPKAPKMTWVHWVLYNLPPDTDGLKEGVQGPDLPAPTLEGKNDWKRAGYGGPCPPIGRHRYYFKLYALDTMLPDLGKPSRTKLEKAIQGHILAEAELMGTYQR